MFGLTLSIVIPVVVFGYGVWLAVRMIRNRKKGACCSGCASCPYAGRCDTAGDGCQLKGEHRDA